MQFVDYSNVSALCPCWFWKQNLPCKTAYLWVYAAVCRAACSVFALVTKLYCTVRISAAPTFSKAWPNAWHVLKLLFFHYVIGGHSWWLVCRHTSFPFYHDYSFLSSSPQSHPFHRFPLLPSHVIPSRVSVLLKYEKYFNFLSQRVILNIIV